MKKLFALLLAVMLVVCMATVVSAAETKTVDVAITVSNNPGFGAYTIKLNYDHDALKLVKLTEGTVTKNVDGNFAPSVKTDKASYFVNNVENVTGNGTLFVATFELQEGAVLCAEYAITATVQVAGDAYANSISLKVAGKTVQPGEHAWGAWSTTKVADCENAGEQVRTCSACAKKDTKTIAALGHKAAAAVVENEVAADCENAGKYDKVVYCSTCDKELSRENVVVPALGHKPAAAVKENEVAPTCTKEGSYDMVVYCSICAKELSRETIKVDALGHKEEVLAAVAPTCTEAGLTEGKKCSVCNEILVAQTEIAALGHDFKDAGIANEGAYDCADEKMNQACSRCDATQVVAHGHECESAKFTLESKYDAELKAHVTTFQNKCKHSVEGNHGCSTVFGEAWTETVEDPKTGDITPYIAMAALTLVALVSAAGYMLKRKAI